jgi:KipI family sensor histidine kinase inhibitor
MTSARPVRVFGDTALVIETDSVDAAHEVAAAIDREGPPAVEDVIVGFRSVTVVADPDAVDLTALGNALGDMATTTRPPVVRRRPPTLVEIPVAFEGSDLDDVARLARVSPAGVVDLLTGTDLQVAFVGFAPGFAYLVGLPPDLAAVPRRRTPRPAVPGGSVALAGGFAGIYPQTSPGGWQLVGRTGIRLFDPEVPPYSALRAGDRVRLRAAEVSSGSDPVPSTGARPSLRSDAGRTVTVESSGLLSFVQDRGRRGVAALGVPRAGAADPDALRMANRMVGNDEDAAAIETTARGPCLRFSAPAHVAVVGTAELSIDGRPLPSDSVVPVAAGQRLTTGIERRGLRSYIAVSGGIDIPKVLGSRSSDVLCGLGPGPLVSGDVLGLGRPERPRGRLRPPAPPGGDNPVRVMLGPDPFPAAAVGLLLSSPWEVDPSSDRIGLRLAGGTTLDVGRSDISSRGMVTGAVQVPPDGRPIVLLCDHATVGGYPVIATVVSADIGLLGQLRPGDVLHLEPVDLPEAVRARVARRQVIDSAVTGWYPVRTD